jgi:hypothetical protein
MSRGYGRVPNVNASLIHEGRMILQQFLGNRQENYYARKVAEAKAGAPKPAVCTHPVLKCCFCVQPPSDAEFIINGYSVCSKHETQAKA